jgi:hypothetical protein
MPLTDTCPNVKGYMSSQEQQEREQRFTRVNLVAVSAGALASISAAVVASYLGVAGTLIGAALVSIVSSLAGAIYSGLLASTHNLVRRTTSRLPGGRVQVPWRRWSLRRPATRWLVIGGAAALMFVVAIGAVTGLEAVIHKPLAAALGGRDEGKATTSVGAALGGSSSRRPAGQGGETTSSTSTDGGGAPSAPTTTEGPSQTQPPPTTAPAPSTTAPPPSTQSQPTR